MGLKYADCTQLGAPNLVRAVVNRRLTRLRAFRWVALNPVSSDVLCRIIPKDETAVFVTTGFIADNKKFLVLNTFLVEK